MAPGRQRVIRVRVVLQHCGGRAGGGADLTATADLVCAGRGTEFNIKDSAALIARAVGVSHADALGVVLDERQLLWRGLEIQTNAACSSTSVRPSLESVTVFPAIFGGDPNRHDEYAAAALQARDSSSIGHVIRGNVAYKVGAVTVVASDRPDIRTSQTAGRDVSGHPRPTDPDDLLNRHLAAFNRHAAKPMNALFHGGCMLQDVALGCHFQGAAIVDTYCRSWWDAFDLRVTDSHCYRGEDGTLTVEAHCTGTHTGTFRSIEPTRRAIDLRVAAILCMRDGLIAEARIYYDAGSLLRQLGVTTAKATQRSCGGLR